MSLLIFTINVQADAIVNNIAVLKSGELAPFAGVLIKKHELIQLEKDADLRDLYEQKLYECTTGYSLTPENPATNNEFYLVATSFLVGVASVLLLKH